MIATVRNPKRAGRSNGCLEPLEDGERLAASEFLRRYQAMPHLKKAELIEGVVYMGSPVSFHNHAAPDGLVQTWLGTYAANTPGTQAGGNGTTRLDIDNVSQPDAVLRIMEDCGGASRLDEGGYLVGAPELVVEISASSASIDLHAKLHVYRRNGVKEYLTWRTVDQEFDWRVLVEGEYRPMKPDAEGVLQSRVFPGLWLSVKSLLGRDGSAVLATLGTGLRSRAHKSFVAQLAV